MSGSGSPASPLYALQRAEQQHCKILHILAQVNAGFLAFGVYFLKEENEISGVKR